MKKPLAVLGLAASSVVFCACGATPEGAPLDPPAPAGSSTTGPSTEPPIVLDAGPSESGPAECPDVEVSFTSVVPTVVLLLDQSGSMNEAFGKTTRWQAMRAALMDPSRGVVKALDGKVRFGMALYTSKNGFAGGACPLLTEVEVGLGNHAALASKLAAAEPVDETPTGESIEKVAASLAALDVPGPKYILLATDGEPDTCAEPNPQNGQAVAVAAAKAARAKGIGTFVVSVGNEVSDKHLQDMANAGAGVSSGAKFWKATDPSGLEGALATITDGVRSCTFTLDGKVTDAKRGTVTLDGAPLTLDGADGWKLVSSTQIELQGAACTKVKSGDHKVKATFACTDVIR